MRHHVRWKTVPDVLPLDIVSQYLFFLPALAKERLRVFDHAKNHIAAMAAATEVTAISTCVRFRNASSHSASLAQLRVK
jgi:hypothetical protein